MKKIIYIIVGCIGVVCATIGALLPVIPTVPFLLISTFCFARSSDRLYNWFIQTDLYKKHLESSVQKRGMTSDTKIRVMITFTIFMLVGFIVMFTKHVVIGCISLVIIWILHIIYFVFIVKTIKLNGSE